MASFEDVVERSKVASAITAIAPNDIATMYPSDIEGALHIAEEQLMPRTMEREDLRATSIFHPADTSYEGNPLVFHNVSPEHTAPLVVGMAQVAMKTYGIAHVTHLDLRIASSNPVSQAAAYEHIRSWYIMPPSGSATDLIIASGLNIDMTEREFEIQSRFCQGLSFLPSSQFCVAVLGERQPLSYPRNEVEPDSVATEVAVGQVAIAA